MTDSMTNGSTVARPKIAISIDAGILRRLDALVRANAFESRSQAIQAAVEEKLERLARRRLARECAKIDPAAERKLAEEGLAADADSWPVY
jgi:Arc/MetJ-type ribon-helix-helix transcriptional regulator